MLYLAEVLQPMLELLKKDAVWVYNEPQEKSFQRAKELLTQAPILIYYDPSKPIIISADVSSYGLEGAIFQEENKTLKVITCLSYSYPNREKLRINRKRTFRECLSLPEV